MADLTPEVYATIAQEALPGEFSQAVNLKLWSTVFAHGVQRIEDVAILLQLARDLNTAAGVFLDQIGQVINQPRLGGAYPTGESDTAYRQKLRAAILRNRSMGTAEQMRAMLLALLKGNCTAVYLKDDPPAAFKALLFCGTALTAAEKTVVIQFVQAAKSAGVGIHGIAAIVAPVFAYNADSYGAPFKGYDDGTNTLGGFWADYFFP